MAKTRVLVVEDSITVRRLIVEVLSADPELEVVAEADDGKRAIELCQTLRPDVMTLDMMLPIMTGVAATEYIMAYCPTPILIVSASTNRGELFRTYEALAAGAVDVLEKPTGREMPDDWERRLVSTVKLVSRIKVITHPRGRLERRGAPSERGAPASFSAAGESTAGSLARPATTVQLPLQSEGGGSYRLIAMGASTGGPGALIEILRALSSDFPLPILLVIHIGALFASAFAEWLSDHSPIPVAYARDGENLPPAGEGRVLVAPADHHLVIRHGKLHLTRDPERHSCRPSVDVLFESVAKEIGAESIGCLLTGMGRDGAEGLLAMRTRGAMTLAQDEATSVVFGMPREAAALGAAAQILALDQIAPVLVALGAHGPARGVPRRRT